VILGDGVFALLLVGLWLFCIIDVITTPEDSVRNLPKLAWLLIIILLVDIGSIAWLVAGRDWNKGTRNLPYKGNRGNVGRVGNRSATASSPRAGSRPGRASNPDDDEEFLAGLRARAEEQRRRAREATDEDPAAG
jgi:hypothetical protein